MSIILFISLGIGICAAILLIKALKRPEKLKKTAYDLLISIISGTIVALAVIAGEYPQYPQLVYFVLAICILLISLAFYLSGVEG
jgi:peptidoglycan/LPS O-acetylase OafA/YrhL